MLENDPLRNILYIDLTKKRFWTEDRLDLFEKWIGGVGVATQILREELTKGVDPLDPGNVIVFAVGPLTGNFLLASKTVAVFKSPLTNNWGESHAGGRSAIAIRMAGFGAIVIKGKSERPVYLSIHDGKVFFKDASGLWGLTSSRTAGRVLRELESGSGLRTIMRIGKAGRKLIKYANVIVDTYRHFGRLGLGAVFGSKNLEAIVIYGRRELPVADKRRYREIYDEIFYKAVKSPLMKKYRDLGTAMNVIPLNNISGLPTRNLKACKFEYAGQISGESFARSVLARRASCAHCPVACIHIGALREPYVDEPYFYKTTFVAYDYGPIASIGPMLGLNNPLDILKMINLVDIYGLDAISTGVVLAWATEALEKKIISKEQTLVDFSWGDLNAYIKGVTFLVDQPNEFYKVLGEGVEFAASKYGGMEFALAFGRNEIPGYHTGPAGYISFLISARHNHSDSFGYELDLESLELSPEKTVDRLVEEEQWSQILSSLVTCYFAREIYTPTLISSALEVLGFNFSPDDLKKLGEKIHYEKYLLAEREGFRISKLHIPRRIFEVPAAKGKIDEEFIRKALEYFSQKMELE
ncbi:MAG: aldehyde ferredoxin oxidoreductase N-terminal domain-containing protein [Candidatus Njordarchaeales archaeon]